MLPESIFVNKTFAYVREWLRNRTRIRGIISLPIETFAPFGTNIKTSILFCSKQNKIDCDNYKIFTGGIENIGYDASGRTTTDADWQGLLNEFVKFLSVEGW